MLKRISLWLLLAVLALLVMLGLLLSIVLYPFMRLVEELSGEGAWYRRQWHRMKAERPPLPDAEFLRTAAIPEDDARLWLAVRHAMADSIGLPADALYPQDRLADLWRMQWSGPDLMDITFRLERSLGVKVDRPAIERFCGEQYTRGGEFHELVVSVVEVLRESQKRNAV